MADHKTAQIASNVLTWQLEEMEKNRKQM